MTQYYHIRLRSSCDLMLYCDNKQAIGIFDLVEKKTKDNVFQGTDLPIIKEVTIATFTGGIVQEYKFKDIYNGRFEIPDNGYAIAVVELPELVYINKDGDFTRLCKYVILEKSNKFIGLLNVRGMKYKFYNTLIDQLKLKTVKVYFYNDYEFQKISPSEYFASMD